MRAIISISEELQNLTQSEILNFLSTRFFNIKGKNPTDWNEEAQSYVLKEVMKEGVKHYF